MKEYHFHTIQSFLADIPAYAAILWLKFSGVFVQVNLPNWEKWFFDHGWFLLLILRLCSVIYDFYIKFEYEDSIKTNTETEKPKKEFSFKRILQAIIKFFIR
jgi:hypothetical protein